MPLRDAHRANVWTGWESVKQNKSFRLFEYGEHMNIDILRTFLAVAEHESLRRAADFMHLTPSAVSARIRQLERSLNTSLFERSKAGVQLTQAGQKLASRSRTLIREWQDIRQEVGSGGRDAVLLRLGARMPCGRQGCWPLPLISGRAMQIRMLSLKPAAGVSWQPC